MGFGAKLQSTWCAWSAQTVQHSSANAALALRSFFWNDDTNKFPLGRNDGTASQFLLVGPNGTYGAIADAVGDAQWGDVIVLEAGTYNESFGLPAGVTLRAEPCAQVVVGGAAIDVDLYGWNTLRGIEFARGTAINPKNVGDVWYEGCKFYLTNPLTEGYQGNLTFRRCHFTDGGVAQSDKKYFMSEGTGSLVDFTMQSCVVSALDLSYFYWAFQIYVTRNVFIENNTFLLGDNVNGAHIFLFSDPVAGGRITRNLHVADQTGGLQPLAAFNSTVGTLVVDHNIGVGHASVDNFLDSTPAANRGSNNAVLPYWQRGNIDFQPLTNALTAQLADAGSGRPRNGAPGYTSTSDTSYPHPLVDFNGFAFADNPSVGAYQQYAESSALYRPWFDIDLFTAPGFESSLLSETPAAPTPMQGDQTYLSHQQVACWLNTYVQDALHPSRASFFVTQDGYYRLVVSEGDFSLNLTGDAVTLLGAFNQNHITDTG